MTARGEDPLTNFLLRSLDWYVDKVRMADAGDKEALQLIGLQQLPSNRIKAWKTTPSSRVLRASFSAATEMAMAARFLGAAAMVKVITISLSLMPSRRNTM